MATLATALRDFYCEYEYDPRGYGHLRLELRTYVCGARVGEVVVASGGIATAILCVCCWCGRTAKNGHVRRVNDACCKCSYKMAHVPSSNTCLDCIPMHKKPDSLNLVLITFTCTQNRPSVPNVILDNTRDSELSVTSIRFCQRER